MSKLKTKPVRIRDSTKDRLDMICRRKNIKAVDAIDHLVDLATQYDLFDADWQSRIVGSSLEEFKEKEKHKQEARIESQKLRSSLRVKRDLLLRYIDTLDAEGRREFIEGVMGEIKDPNFLDSISDLEVVLVNGKRRLIRMSEGKPVMPNVDAERILTCETGYHVRDAFCDCQQWRECKLRKDEYVDFMVRTGRTPPSQKPGYRRRRI